MGFNSGFRIRAIKILAHSLILMSLFTSFNGQPLATTSSTNTRQDRQNYICNNIITHPEICSSLTRHRETVHTGYLFILFRLQQHKFADLAIASPASSHCPCPFAQWPHTAPPFTLHSMYDWRQNQTAFFILLTNRRNSPGGRRLFTFI